MNTTLVLIDDDPDTLELLEMVLDDYQVVSFLDAGSLMNWLETNPLPSLILSDVMMNDMDGYELCYHFRRSGQYPDFPVILMSGMTEDIDFRRAIEAGASEYIEKPVSVRRLRQVLEKQLKQFQPA